MATRRCGLRLWLACCLLGASGGIVPAALYAETRTAASLTPEAVWDAIDAAKDGDTVHVCMPPSLGGYPYFPLVGFWLGEHPLAHAFAQARAWNIFNGFNDV